MESSGELMVNQGCRMEKVQQTFSCRLQ